ncbi:MAG: peptidylprolyl isomerase [Anaeromyxobacteraceae bacterium]
MSRTLTCAALAALALAACKGNEAKKSGPAVAKGDNFTITADEFKARLDEQSPFIRARFASLDRKKEFLDNLVKFEVLAAEAKKQGFDKDPDVQTMMKRVMVQKLVQKSFADDTEAAKKIPEADVAAYYDQHKDEYHRPAKARVAQIVVKAPAAGPERAKQEAEAQKLLARVRAEEKRSPAAFATVAREASQDDATKAAGGDLGFRSKDELATQASPQVAEAAFALKDGEVSNLVPTAQGFAIVKRTGWQDALDRPLDSVKPQIAAKLARERHSKDFDDFVKKLREQANVKVDDKALEAVPVAGAPAGGMGAGMGMGMGGPAGSAVPPGHGGAPTPGHAAPGAPNAPAAQPPAPHKP